MEQLFITKYFTLLPMLPNTTNKGSEFQRDINKVFKQIHQIEEESIRDIPVLNSRALLVYALPDYVIKKERDEYISLPMAYKAISMLKNIPAYNKVVIHFTKNTREKLMGNFFLLHIALQAGEKFISINTFDAQDINTVIYYILLTLKNSQLNPAQTSVLTMTSLTEKETDLFQDYFRKVIVNDISSAPQTRLIY